MSFHTKINDNFQSRIYFRPPANSNIQIALCPPSNPLVYKYKNPTNNLKIDQNVSFGNIIRQKSVTIFPNSIKTQHKKTESSFENYSNIQLKEKFQNSELISENRMNRTKSRDYEIDNKINIDYYKNYDIKKEKFINVEKLLKNKDKENFNVSSSIELLKNKKSTFNVFHNISNRVEKLNFQNSIENISKKNENQFKFYKKDNIDNNNNDYLDPEQRINGLFKKLEELKMKSNQRRLENSIEKIPEKEIIPIKKYNNFLSPPQNEKFRSIRENINMFSSPKLKENNSLSLIKSFSSPIEFKKDDCIKSSFLEKFHIDTKNPSHQKNESQSFIITPTVFKKNRKNEIKEKIKEIDYPTKMMNSTLITIQDFSIGKCLGKGRFGSVYLAQEKKSKFFVALKVIQKKTIKDTKMANQIKNELKIQSFLNHPNILKLYGFFHDKDQFYFILEYAHDGELYKKMKNETIQRFEEKIASRYVKQVLDAVLYLHSNDVIHRDIKPENILISFDILKLSDFGWATYSPSTKRQTFCGTLDYVSPEIVGGSEYSEKVDVWSLGVLCYELCTGRPPFEKKSNVETFNSILSVQYQVPEYFSEEIKDFLNKILIREQDKRPNLKELVNHPWITKNNK